MMAVVFQKSFQVIKTKSTLLQTMSMVADVKEKISDNNLILLFFFFTDNNPGQILKAF